MKFFDSGGRDAVELRLPSRPDSRHVFVAVELAIQPYVSCVDLVILLCRIRTLNLCCDVSRREEVLVYLGVSSLIQKTGRIRHGHVSSGRLVKASDRVVPRNLRYRHLDLPIRLALSDVETFLMGAHARGVEP